MATEKVAQTGQQADDGPRPGSERLPTGTVSFLLTDIEGSTRMWRSNPEAMLEAVTRHRQLIHRCIERYRGVLPKDQGEGDSVFAAFERATDAVAAVLALQVALAEEHWPEGVPVRVRAAVHTGEAEIRDGNYYGSALSRTARIRAGLGRPNPNVSSDVPAGEGLPARGLPGPPSRRLLAKGLRRAARTSINCPAMSFNPTFRHFRSERSNLITCPFSSPSSWAGKKR